MSSALSDDAITEALRHIPGWDRVEQAITRTYRFGDFKEAMAFVNRVAAVAEGAGHHPDIAIHGNVVTLTLWTHAVGGLTAKDFKLAHRIDAG